MTPNGNLKTELVQGLQWKLQSNFTELISLFEYTTKIVEVEYSEFNEEHIFINGTLVAEIPSEGRGQSVWISEEGMDIFLPKAIEILNS